MIGETVEYTTDSNGNLQVYLTCSNPACGKTYTIKSYRKKEIEKHGWKPYCSVPCRIAGQLRNPVCKTCGSTHLYYRSRTKDLRCRDCHSVTKCNGDSNVQTI